MSSLATLRTSISIILRNSSKALFLLHTQTRFCSTECNDTRHALGGREVSLPIIKKERKNSFLLIPICNDRWILRRMSSGRQDIRALPGSPRAGIRIFDKFVAFRVSSKSDLVPTRTSTRFAGTLVFYNLDE